jgi:hypothetical protein
MKNINKLLIINAVQAYNIFEKEMPKFAKKHKTNLLNITPEDASIVNFARRYLNYLDDNLSRRAYRIIKSKIENNEAINIDIRGHMSPTNIYLKDSAFQYLSKDVHEITTNKYAGESPMLENRLMSNSLKDSLYDIAYETKREDNGYLLRHLVSYLRYKEFQKGQDRNFTIRKNGDMTYLPSNKESIVTDNDKWDVTGRQEIKYGKGIRKMFSHVYDITEKEVEMLSNKLSEKFKFCAEFRVVEGKDITLWYHYSRYAENSGTLNGSCMKHSSCQGYFGIYEDSAKMLIAVNKEGKLIGRALLWDDVMSSEINDNINLMDRIYGNDITIEAFKTWAYANGYYHKAYQSYSDLEQIIDPKTKKQENHTLTIKVKGKHPMYPYMDTFKSTDDCIETDEYLEICNHKIGDIIFEDTDGLVNSEDYVNVNGRRVHIDEARFVERYGEYYHTDDVVYTEDCEFELYEDCHEIEGEWYHKDSSDIVYSDYEDGYILIESAICVDDVWFPQDADCLRWSEHLQETVHEDDVVYSESLQDYIPLEEAVECHISNEWILKEDAIEITTNNRTYYANSEIYTNEELLTKIEE